MAPTLRGIISTPSPEPSETIDVSSSDDEVIVISDDDGSGDIPDDDGGSDGATSRPRRGRYRCWDVEDECKIINTIAKLRADNMGVTPGASVVLRTLQKDSPLRRRDATVCVLTQKMYRLKKKFANYLKNGSEHLRRYRGPRKRRETALYECSKVAWPELITAAARKARPVHTSTGGKRIGFNS